MPVCYLRPWQDRPGQKGVIEVERIVAGTAVKRFECKPSNILSRKGYYDMSADLAPLPRMPASLLETDVLARATELAFTKTRSQTLDVGTSPTLSQTAFLAEFCLTLYFRSPRFHRMTESFVDSQDWNSFEKKVAKVVKHQGARTLALTIAGANEVVRNAVFHLHEAGGTQRFWTTDTPCWMWYRDGVDWKPTCDLVDLTQRTRLAVTATRWLCPLTPKWLMEICPVSAKGQVLRQSRLTDVATQAYNAAICQVAAEFRICPPR